MGCRFCASTLDGLVRGLRPSEMIDQIYQIGKDIGAVSYTHLVCGLRAYGAYSDIAWTG